MLGARSISIPRLSFRAAAADDRARRDFSPIKSAFAAAGLSRTGPAQAGSIFVPLVFRAAVCKASLVAESDRRCSYAATDRRQVQIYFYKMASFGLLAIISS